VTDKTIIGFLDYQDFERELLDQNPATPVRVQNYVSTIQKSGQFVRVLNYYVVAGFQTPAGIFLVRFHIAEVHTFVDEMTPDQLTSTSSAVRTCHLARLALQTRIQSEGFSTAPGLIGGSKKTDTTAPLSTLWEVAGIPDGTLPFTDPIEVA